MRPIKYSEITSRCDYRDYGCTETSCPFNIGHVPQKPFFTISDIPDERCLITLDMIADEMIDIAIRLWMKDVLDNPQKIRPVPPEITEILKREASEMYPPTRPLCSIEDIGKRPTNG